MKGEENLASRFENNCKKKKAYACFVHHLFDVLSQCHTKPLGKPKSIHSRQLR